MIYIQYFCMNVFSGTGLTGSPSVVRAGGARSSGSGEVLYVCVTTVVLSTVFEKVAVVALRFFFPLRFGQAPLWGMGETK